MAALTSDQPVGVRLCVIADRLYLVRNGPLLASTIDEEYFASLSLIYTIFSVAILVCVELKYNTRSCPEYLLSL